MVYEGEGIAILLLGIILGCLILGGIIIARIRRTKNYRNVLTDLFVAGKLKQLAEKHKIDLDKEFIDFIKWEKKHKKYEYSIDAVIEAEIKEQLDEIRNKDK